jgi:hypothetical protein
MGKKALPNTVELLSIAIIDFRTAAAAMETKKRNSFIPVFPLAASMDGFIPDLCFNAFNKL